MEQKINLELKYFCKDFNSVRSILKSLGAKKESVKMQKDYFFNLPDKKQGSPARLKLRLENGNQKLVFYRRPDFSAKKATPADVALLNIKDKNILPFLIKSLGLRVIVDKKRERWKKDNTVFHLDKVKGIGNVFEIEVWSKANNLKKDRLKFEIYKKALLPCLDKVIKGSNENLVLKREG